MRRNLVITILWKELLDTIRDKKTLLINIVLPMVIWPLTAALVTQVAATQLLRQQEKISRIALAGDVNTEISDRLAADTKMTIVEIEEPIHWVF